VTISEGITVSGYYYGDGSKLTGITSGSGVGGMFEYLDSSTLQPLTISDCLSVSDLIVSNDLTVTNTAKADNVQVAGDTLSYTSDFYIAQQDVDAVGTDLSISNVVTVSGTEYVEIANIKIGQDLTTDGTNLYFKGVQL
jgi:hypothetical protein